MHYSMFYATMVTYVAAMLNSFEYIPSDWKTPDFVSFVLNTILITTAVNSVLCSGLLLMKYVVGNRKRTPPFKGVPLAPGAHWLVGHAFAFWDNKKSLTEKFALLFGDVVNKKGLGSIFLGSDPFLVVTRCEDVQNVLRTSSTTAVSPQIRRHYAKRAGDNEALAHLAQGKVWKTKRQFVHKIFTRNLPNCTEGMIKVACDLSASVLTLIRDSGRTNASGVSTRMIDVERITTLAMFDNFGIMAFGRDFGVCETLKEHKVADAIAHQFDDFEGRVKDIFNPCSQFYSIPTNKNRARQEADATIRAFYRQKVEERLAGESTGNNTDVLSFLKTEIENNKKATVGSAVDLLQTLFNGATTTSAGTLMFALYAVSLDPAVEAHCLEEIHRVIGRRSSDNRHFDVSDLHYCRAVILETVRLYPSIPANTRVLEHEIELGGKKFAPGTKVMLPVFVVQRDKRHFPMPLHFFPDRWVQKKKDGSWTPRTTDVSGNGSGGGIANGNKEAFVAFSSGGRNCVGQRLAIHQTTIGLAILVRDVKMNVRRDYVMDLYYEGITMRPRHGMPMECVERCEACK
jgi:cytochrome P450